MQNQINFNRGVVRPIQAYNDAGELLRGYYGGFLGVIIVAILMMFVGGLVPLAPLTPPMMCGIYLCLFNRIHGHQFNTSTLFKGFEYFGQSFIASLFYSLPMFIVSIVSTIVLQIGMSGITLYIESLKLDKNPKPQIEEVLPTLIGAFGSFFGLLFGVVFVTIILAFVLRMVVVFAYPLIVEHKMDGFSAVKLSCRALMVNFFGVLGLLILETIFIFAGIMCFYIGIIFVLPFIHAAWFCAYRRVFAQPNLENQQNVWTPEGTSKVGRNLLLGAIAVFIFSATTFTIGGFFVYQSITNLIEKAKIENANRIKQKPETISPISVPTPSYPTNSKLPANGKIVSGGVVNGKAINLVQPEYPPAAKAVRASGTVNVQVTIDEQGNIVSASAVSGNPLLRTAAEKAARESKFAPTMLSGKAVKVTGVIVYNFKLQ